MSKKTLTLLATIIGSGIVFLDGTIVNLALPHIQVSLHTQFSDLQWIADGYLLSLSALILLGGSLGDIFGRKRTYLVGLTGFGTVSLLCGFAPNVGFLIALRILQGLFGALLVPGGLAIINTNFERSERGAAIGKWSAWSGIMTAAGPLVGGYVIDATSWRWIFFINVPLVIFCGWLAILGIEESKDRRARKVDGLGAILAALALGGLTYGLIEGPVERWASQTIIPLIAGAMLTLIFLWFEARSTDPMVELRLFANRNFSGANLMTFAMYGALSGFMFSLVIYMQTKLGYSAIKAGASLLPASAMLLLFSSRVGALSQRLGPRLFMSAGPAVAGMGMLLLISYRPGQSYLWFLLPRIVLFSIGLVLFVAPLTTTVMTSVNEASSGIASGINNAVSRVAGLVVISVLGILGAGYVFRFSMILCGCMALVASLFSYFIIRSPRPLSTS